MMDIEADYNSNDLMANNPASSNINNFNFSFSNNFIQNNSKLTKINNLNNINFLRNLYLKEIKYENQISLDKIKN